MDFISYANAFFTVIKNFVVMLFQMMIVPGVSIGSLLLYCLLVYVIVTNFYFRR